jgi:D-amino-acid dehydrogenase
LQGRPDFRKLRALVPDIRRAHRRPLGGVQAEWLGFRPSMPDSLPVIGAAPGTPNALLAFGHGHLGLTMGPVTGALVAELIDGATPRVDLRPFSPMRFRRG